MLINAENVFLSQGKSTRIACPDCSVDRKKSGSRDCVITKKLDGGLVYFCHHCGAKGSVQKKGGSVKLNKFKQETIDTGLTEIMKDVSVRKGALSKDHYDYLQSRGISKETAKKAQLFAAEKYFNRLGKKSKAIGFPYTKNNEVIGVKYRSLESKDFTQDSGGSSLLFNIDSVVEDKPLIIVEGEIDCLSLIECGIENAVSVPTGAPLKVADGKVHPSEDRRFQYIWNAHEIITKVPQVIIATDNDTAGKALAEELARRIGKDKCGIVNFDGSKDFNEVLLNKGKTEVSKLIDEAKPYPVEGLSSPVEFLERLNELRLKGTGKGESVGFSNVDEIYTVVQGQLTVVTGYPSSGKSNFVDQMMVNLAKKSNWNFAVCSFENAPELHIARLMEIQQNKKFFEGKDRMTEEEHKDAFSWVNDHFTFLTHESSEPSTIDSILDRLKVAVARSGIRGAVIDPYNYIIMDKETSETESISNMLTRIQSFAKSYGVHIWFVAHPAKMQRQGTDLPRPDGMSISGSMAWWAKADVGLTVYRKDQNTEIICWKCRYRWVGQTGIAELEYNLNTGTYKEVSDGFS